MVFPKSKGKRHRAIKSMCRPQPRETGCLHRLVLQIKVYVISCVYGCYNPGYSFYLRIAEKEEGAQNPVLSIGRGHEMDRGGRQQENGSRRRGVFGHRLGAGRQSGIAALRKPLPNCTEAALCYPAPLMGARSGCPSYAFFIRARTAAPRSGREQARRAPDPAFRPPWLLRSADRRTRGYPRAACRLYRSTALRQAARPRRTPSR